MTSICSIFEEWKAVQASCVGRPGKSLVQYKLEKRAIGVVARIVSKE